MPCVGLRIGIVPPNRSCLPKWGSRLNRGCQLQGSSPPPESLSWRRFPQTRPNRGSPSNLRSPPNQCSRPNRGSYLNQCSQLQGSSHPNQTIPNLCCQLQKLGTNQKQRGIFSAKSNRVPNMGSSPNL